MAVLSDLQQAIYSVLVQSYPIEGNGVKHLEGYWLVDEDALKQLQAEYNINFLEPDEEQLEVIPYQ